MNSAETGLNCKFGPGRISQNSPNFETLVASGPSGVYYNFVFVHKLISAAGSTIVHWSTEKGWLILVVGLYRGH
jgi:hypothetical protein